jgi:DNA repair protein RadA/Sms
MAKTKTIYVCQNCGAESSKWIGRCPSCKEWNSYHEEIISQLTPRDGIMPFQVEKKKPELLENIRSDEKNRSKTGIDDLDRILGGGMVAGSLILLGGEPGVGKSTLALQLALAIDGRGVLYVSGEESEEQISLRAKRLKNNGSGCYVYSETDLKKYLFSRKT